MKKMFCGSYVCDVAVVENYVLEAPKGYAYGKDTVAYAVERFFATSPRFLRECTVDSFLCRVAKGKKNKRYPVSYRIRAREMQLPGLWIRVSGEMGPAGVTVKRVEVLDALPAGNFDRKCY